MIRIYLIDSEWRSVQQLSGLLMSNRDAILAVLAGFADTFGLDQSNISPNATLYDLGVDSLQLIELMFRFEEAFNIQLPLEAFGHQTTVAEAIATIEQLIEVQACAPATR